MPDLTLCSGGRCGDKFSCWRYLCPSGSNYQPIMEPPEDTSDLNPCEFYILTDSSWMIRPVEERGDV